MHREAVIDKVVHALSLASSAYGERTGSEKVVCHPNDAVESAVRLEPASRRVAIAKEENGDCVTPCQVSCGLPRGLSCS